jgi:hypothetical protein
MIMDMVVTDFSSGKLKTNYWNTNWATEGAVYGVIYQKTLHLLLPLNRLSGGGTLEETVAEMRTGHRVIISRYGDGYDFTFDDGTETPYGIHVHRDALFQDISPKDNNREDVTVMVHLADGTTIEWPAVVQIS